jgi:hypothetical protein
MLKNNLMHLKKAIPIIAILLIALLSLGCASTEIVAKKNIATVSLSADTRLIVSRVQPLAIQGAYLQKIKTTFKDKQNIQEHSFSVYLTVAAEKVDAIAFNDISGRLYQLTWTPNQLTWIRSKYIPKALKPENIIADFLATHSSIKQLNASLLGAKASETLYKQAKVRIIENNSGILRSITYTHPAQSLWQNIRIENPQLGYTLDIQTVPQ